MFYLFSSLSKRETEIIFFVFCLDFVMHFFVVTSFSLSVACGIEHVYINYIDGLRFVLMLKCGVHYDAENKQIFKRNHGLGTACERRGCPF